MVTLDLADGRRFHYELRTGLGDRHHVPWAYLTTLHPDGTGSTIRIAEQDALGVLRQHGVID